MRHPAPPPAITHEQVRTLLAADLSGLPEIRVGVATSAFQTEGGLDEPGQPATNWARWAAEGRVERIGPACDLWRRFDEIALRCKRLGLDVFRMSIEWARVAPHGERLDAHALRGYAARIATLCEAGLEPIVTLQHFTHPEWLGEDFWLDDRAPEIFARYAVTVVRSLGDALVRRGLSPLRRILTINEPNMLASASYIAGIFPHGRGALAEGDPLGVPRALRALDHMMAAHVRTYRALHALYAERGWPAPDVSWNINFVDVYGTCKLLFDLLRAPELGVAPAVLDSYVARCRERFASDLFEGERSARVEAARALDGMVARLVAPDIFAATLGLLYERRGARAVDSIAVDVYDPWSHNQIRGASELFAALGRGDSVLALIDHVRRVRLADPWEWDYDPMTFVRALRAMNFPERSLPLDVMENGMAEHRPPGGTRGARADGISRPDFIRGYTFALAYARAVERVPVRTYCHWTLVDNYELGRWAPRFGLFALPDPQGRSACAWSQTDSAGNDAGASLAAFARALAEGRSDLSAMREVLAHFFGAAPSAESEAASPIEVFALG